MSDSAPGEVTQWLDGFRAKEPQAQAFIFRRYLPKLTAYARNKVLGENRRLTVAEGSTDAYTQAFMDLCDEVHDDPTIPLSNHKDLERLLRRRTESRALDILRKAMAQKRGGGRVVGESDLVGEDGEFGGLMDLLATEENARLLEESCEEMFAALPDDLHRQVARIRVDDPDCTDAQVAKQVGVSVSTVKRILKKIREVWAPCK